MREELLRDVKGRKTDIFIAEGSCEKMIKHL